MEHEEADAAMRTLTDGRGSAARPSLVALAPDATGAEQVGKPADDSPSVAPSSMPATLVELVDGTIVMRDAAEWAHECLARHVLSLPSLAQRRAWLADFERLHGKPETERLQATMWKLHDHAAAKSAVLRPQEALMGVDAATPLPGAVSQPVDSSGAAGGQVVADPG